MYTSICWYLRILPVLHRPDVVDIGVNSRKKNMPYATRTFLSIQYVHGDLIIMLAFRNRFEYRSNTFHLDRYSNIFLNAYINHLVHAKYLKMI